MTTQEDALILTEDELTQLLEGIELPLSGLLEPLEWPFEFVARLVVRWAVWAAERVAQFLVTVGGALWDFLQDILSPLFDSVHNVLLWLSEVVSSMATWLWDQVRPALEGVRDLASDIWDAVSTFVGDIGGVISSQFELITSFWGGLLQSGVNRLGVFVEDSTQWVGELVVGVGRTIREEIADPITDFFMDLPERFAAFLQPWIDVAGAIRRGLDWFIFPWETKEIAHAYRGLFTWIQDEITEAVDSAWDAIMGTLKAGSPLNPLEAPSTARGLLTLGAVSAGGLGLMTLGGELVHPLKSIGMGQVAAMVWDVINFREITGMIMRTVLEAGLRIPLRYYIQDILRPWLLDPRDFRELLARNAFMDPERLRTPELIETVNAVAVEGRSQLIDSLIGFYGFPANYRGFFQELAFTRLGYFPLAGIARTGFFDEEWFLEALARTGYSFTAREALMNMYREMVFTSKVTPSMFHLRRLLRDGFTTPEAIRERLAEVAALPNLLEARLFAFGVEREYEQKSGDRDIILRAFSRGLITEGEARQGLEELGLVADTRAQELMREKLGLVRRVSLEVPQVTTTVEIIEEE
ncbi:MAG: hypothetical protein ACE5IA_02340 [Dehalococcoidia bacterium]